MKLAIPKQKTALVGTAGTSIFCTIPELLGRGAHECLGRAFEVLEVVYMKYFPMPLILNEALYQLRLGLFQWMTMEHNFVLLMALMVIY